ncbi:MAG: glycosyltransferase [candidate division KSB1 bacterium]|nr:glycosyltransferase [candidate division KSB1 bacterium]
MRDRSVQSTDRPAALIVSYYFPPAGGSGVQRVLKFVKYLPEFGWRPIVLTARGADYPTLDPSLGAEVPASVWVLRSRIVEPYALYRRLTGKKDVQHLDVVVLTRRTDQKLSERMAEWVRSTFFVPDARIGWLPFAVHMGVRAARLPGVRVVVSSAPPYTCHLIGYLVHRLSGKPWVADFRDSWVDWVSAPRRRGFSRRVDLALEGLVLRGASLLVSVSEGVRDDLVSRHPEARDHHWVLIPNGFDPEDFEGLAGEVREEKLTLLYSGSLYGPRHPGTLLRGLRLLREESWEGWGALRLRIVGRIAKEIREEIEREAGDIAECSDYLPHREAVRELLRCDVAVLIVDAMPASKGVLTGKLFEYLGARKPILAIAPPEGEAARLIAEGGCGWIVSPGDAEGVARALREIYRLWRQGQLPRPTEEFVARFDRRKQAQQLAEWLERLACGKEVRL